MVSRIDFVHWTISSSLNKEGQRVVSTGFCVLQNFPRYCPSTSSEFYRYSRLATLCLHIEAAVIGLVNFLQGQKNSILLSVLSGFRLHNSLFMLRSSEASKLKAALRSEPSSRTFLIGEQPNPWDLLQPQDKMSRHRCRYTHITVRIGLYLHPTVITVGDWRVVSTDSEPIL